MRISLSTLGTIAVAALLVAPGAVSAREVDGFVIDRPSRQQSFAAIIETDPTNPAPVTSTRTLTTCRDQATNYAHAVLMGMAQPRENGHETTLTLTWPGMDDGSNNLLLFVYTPEGELLDQESSPGGPKSVKITDLPNEPFYICVWNRSGTNQGYTIRGDVRLLDMPDGSAPEPTPEPTPAPTAAPQTAAPARAPTPPPDPTPTPEVLVTPGPDGTAAERDLGVIAVGRQASPLTDEGRSYRMVFGALTLLILLAGGAIVALRIRREL